MAGIGGAESAAVHAASTYCTNTRANVQVVNVRAGGGLGVEGGSPPLCSKQQPLRSPTGPPSSQAIHRAINRAQGRVPAKRTDGEQVCASFVRSTTALRCCTDTQRAFLLRHIIGLRRITTTTAPACKPHHRLWILSALPDHRPADVLPTTLPPRPVPAITTIIHRRRAASAAPPLRCSTASLLPSPPRALHAGPRQRPRYNSRILNLAAAPSTRL
ncbi:hypothetical protein MBLNU459_g1842t1 [Dothideomycetes sp. NU459]